MTSEEFWKGDPQLFVAYRTSFINKEKREMEKWDYKCWLQGAYVDRSNQYYMGHVNQTIYNGFQGFAKQPKFDTAKIEGYPIKPFNELEKDKKNQKQIEQDNLKQQNKTLICQAGLKQAFIEKTKRQREKGDNNGTK